MFGDFLNYFYPWGQGLLRGEYNAVYPLPMAYVFSIFSLFSPFMGLGVILLLDLIILVKLFRKQAFIWLWYMPFLVNLTVGNLDMIFFYLYQLNTWWGMVLLTLKPQLFILALPKIWKWKKTELKKLIWGVVGLYTPFFLIRPMWVFEWIRNVVFTQDSRLGQNDNASFFGFWPMLLLLSGVLYFSKIFPWKAVLFCVNPGLRPYDAVFFMGSAYEIIPISWGIQWLERTFSVYWVWSLIPLYLIIKGMVVLYSYRQRHPVRVSSV